MDIATFFGVLTGFGLVVGAIMMGPEPGKFFDIASVMIVFGGTAASILVTFPLEEVMQAVRGGFKAFGTKRVQAQDVVNTMVRIAEISRREGLIALENVQTENALIRKACQLIADNAESGLIRGTVSIEIASMKRRHNVSISVFNRLGGYAPAFGMIGTLIGLVQMLASLDDPSSIGPAMAVAIITTFYGALLSNLLLSSRGPSASSRTTTPGWCTRSFPRSCLPRSARMADDDELGMEMEEDEPPMGWLATLADISMLLLCFFILLFALSTIDKARVTETFDAVRTVFGGKDTELTTSAVRSEDSGALLETVRLQRQIVEAQRNTYSEMRTYLTRNGMEGVIGAVFDEGVITLRIPAEVMFAPGETELNPQAERYLKPLADLFVRKKEQSINIRGFTDDSQPSPTSRFRDNWELSSLRAVSVLRYFLKAGIDSKRLTATGLGELDPLFPNTTEENRARNRRVEFMLERRVTK